MSDDQISQVFEPYTRFAGENIEGDGLGLALTRAFARMNECELWVCSVPQQGTTVTLSVPAGENKSSPMPAREGERAGTVLISDDQIEASLSLSRILEMNGYDVRMAVSIEESRSVICSFRPRLLITDLSFADGDGEGLIRFVLSNLKDCEIVVVSGRELYSVHHDLFECPNISFLRKPLDVPLLLSHLKRGSSAPRPTRGSDTDQCSSRQVA